WPTNRVRCGAWCGAVAAHFQQPVRCGAVRNTFSAARYGAVWCERKNKSAVRCGAWCDDFGAVRGSNCGSSINGLEVNPPAYSTNESGKVTDNESCSTPFRMRHEEVPMVGEKGGTPKIVEKSYRDSKTSEKEGPSEEEREVTKWKHFKNEVGRFLTYLLLFILFWGSLVYIVHDMALPGGTIFSLLILIVTAQLGGMLVAKIHLPPLLGMLLVGILFRSAPFIDTIGKSISTEWSSSLRSMALVVILIRAGLGLDPVALKKLSYVVLRLAVCPCLVETTTVAVVSHLLLDFPWKWAFLLGFILAAVSPAVVVPCLLNLADQGFGVEKGIPTLVIAAASIDDVIAISGFGVCLGTIFSNGSSLWQGLKGPMEIGMGIAYGLIVGLILWVLPSKKEGNANIYRFLMLFCAGLLAIFGSKGIDFGGAGALGCLCVAFIAGYGWRREGRVGNKKPVSEYFNFVWILLQPMLFGLIGTEIRVGDLHPATVGWGVVTLIIGLTLRVIVSFFAVLGGGLTLKERCFVTLAWLPKATVQVLTIAVLVILITAPVGAVAIMLSAIV
ncbi:Mitochondrial sodium/hydrogen exchanger 9B2, partial [Armadillidium vulgare]